MNELMNQQLENAWINGITAKRNGQSRDSNPFTNPVLVEQWDMGYTKECNDVEWMNLHPSAKRTVG